MPRGLSFVKSDRGPYIKDVRTEGGGGEVENCQILRTNSTDRLREMRTKGGGGVENPKNFADVLYVWSRTELTDGFHQRDVSRCISRELCYLKVSKFLLGDSVGNRGVCDVPVER